MNKNYTLRNLLYILFLVVASLLLLVSTGAVANASALFQDITPLPTAIPATPVPDSGTGGNPAFFLPGWLILLLVGVLGMVLLLLLLRPVFPVATPHEHHEHHEPHDHIP